MPEIRIKVQVEPSSFYFIEDSDNWADLSDEEKKESVFDAACELEKIKLTFVDEGMPNAELMGVLPCDDDKRNGE